MKSLDLDAASPRGRSETAAHLSADQLFAFTRFFDSARLIEEAMKRYLLEEHAMTLTDHEILVRLDGDDGPLRLTALSERCVSPMPNITQTLVRLEDRGSIRREKAVGDARGAFAHLLPAGAAALRGGRPETRRDHQTTAPQLLERRRTRCHRASDGRLGRAIGRTALLIGTGPTGPACTVHFHALVEPLHPHVARRTG